MYIVITRDGRKGEAVPASLPENEAKLQKYLEENLASLPWAELEQDLDLFPIGREFRTRSGRGERTDLLAQALDYGASIWSSYPNARDLADALDAKYSFKSKAQSHFKIDDEAMLALLGRFEANIREARFRFVVVMDAVDDDLKDLIRFYQSEQQLQGLRGRPQVLQTSGHRNRCPHDVRRGGRQTIQHVFAVGENE